MGAKARVAAVAMGLGAGLALSRCCTRAVVRSAASSASAGSAAGVALAVDTVGALVPHGLSSPLLGAGSGVLAGKTFVLKDLFDVKGRKTGNGNPTVFERAEPAERSAAVLTALLGAGAHCTGIAVCDEFFYSIAGVNHHYGTPHNTHGPGRIPGGSSSGSAAAVAAGLCDFAVGSDTGGSVRIPAAFCGVYGLRPTHGRISLEGATAMAPSFDACGFFARSASLMEAVGSVLLPAGSAVAQPAHAPLTVLLAQDALARTTGGVGEVLRAALDAMVGGGALPTPRAVAAAPPGRDLLEWWDSAFRLLQGWEVAHAPAMLPWVRENEGVELGPGIKERMAIAGAITKEQAEAAAVARATYAAAVRAMIPPGTVMVVPSAPCTALPKASTSEEMDAFRSNAMATNSIAGLSGLPQVSLPVAIVEGEGPVGLSFIGWQGGDEALLALAASLEDYCHPKLAERG